MEKSMHEIYVEQSTLEADDLVQFPCEEENQTPVYYLKCTYFWPEFKETATFPYCVNHVCDWQERIEVSTQEEADKAAAEANAVGFVCPKCGQRAKLKGATQFEIYNDKRILESINRSELNHG